MIVVSLDKWQFVLALEIINDVLYFYGLIVDGIPSGCYEWAEVFCNALPV